MEGDKRRIQTAVLGSADSEEPLLLPMEAIELDAFRHRYADRSFWCGRWLGGCGQLHPQARGLSACGRQGGGSVPSTTRHHP